MVGFKFDEVMSGTHEWITQPGAKFDMEFNVRWGPDNVIKWISDDLVCPLEGTITIGGFCDRVPCKGTISLHYWAGEIKYDIHFIVNDIAYNYRGEKKDIRPWNLHRTHTTCYGVLIQSWNKRVISKSITYFRLKTLPSFLASFRIT
jgi:hypothetical protein